MLITIRLAFFNIFSFLTLPSAEAAAPSIYKFAEVKSHKEIGSLPPKLMLTFDLFCNENFVKVIRYDKTEAKTGKAVIAVGVLVEENLLSSCAGQSKEMTVPAGKTFSGRQFEIAVIKK